MGLFIRKPAYITDRGDVYDVEDMASSHLLNAIKHHRHQIETIEWVLGVVPKSADLTQVERRKIQLHSTVEALVTELLTRDPDKDHDDEQL